MGDMEDPQKTLPERDLMMGNLCKKKLRYFMSQEEAEHYKDHKQMENHLYECIYGILRSNTPQADKLPALKCHKAKLVRLNALRMEKVMLNNNAQDKIDGEKITLFHILKMLKRREARTNHQVQKPLGNIIDKPQDIIHDFVTYLRKKYGPIAVDSRCVATVMDVIRPTRPTTYADSLERPITPRGNPRSTTVRRPQQSVGQRQNRPRILHCTLGNHMNGPTPTPESDVSTKEYYLTTETRCYSLPSKVKR